MRLLPALADSTFDALIQNQNRFQAKTKKLK